LKKDLNILSDYVKHVFNTIVFQDHKKFLTNLYSILEDHGNFFTGCLNINGFFFSINGKVGIAGNGKKKGSFTKFGRLEKSTKFSKIEHKQIVIKTYYGSYGINMFLSY
jgi:hypothetical protein